MGTEVVEWRDSIDAKLFELEMAEKQVNKEKKELLKAKRDLKTTQIVQELFQRTAKTVQEKAHSQVSNIVSRCLNEIFTEDEFEFEIRFEKKRNTTAATMVLFENGKELDPRSELSGGVIDVASFALRISAILLSNPPVRRIVILDEPFKNIRGRQYRSRIRNLVLGLAKELDMQFIINIDTDSYPEFQLGKVIELE